MKGAAKAVGVLVGVTSRGGVPHLSRMFPVMVLAFLAALAVLTWAHPARAETVSFVDDSGQEVEFAKPFHRIVSLYAAHTENLFSLGLKDEIVAVSGHESYPPEALTRPALSSRDDPERFLALKPDLVLIRPMVYMGHRPLVDRLEAAGIKVVSLQPGTIKEMMEYWRRLGLMTGRQEAARAMERRFGDGLARLDYRVAGIPREKRPKVFFESIHGKMKTFAPGAMALFALEEAGGVNVAEDATGRRGTNIAEYGKERILSHAANIDVYLSQTGPMNQVTVEDIRREPGFGAIKAVAQGRIYLVPEDLVSRPTLRLLEGANLIQGLLYPHLEKP